MKQVKFKKVDLSKVNDAYLKVMYWFFAYPDKEISLNELAKLVNISKTTANRIVSQLVKEEFLKVLTFGKVWRISCNQQHKFNNTKKIAYNLGLVYESGIVEEILKAIPSSRSIILFGSYRKGYDISTSDLDIAVEILGSEETAIFQLGVIPQLGYKQEVKVNILKFTRNKVDLNLFANLCNGIVLYGFLEVRL